MLAQQPAEAPADAGSERTDSAPRPAPRSALRWLTDADRVARARAEVGQPSAAQQELRRRADLTRDLAERLLEQTDPARHGSAAAVVAKLYLEAIYWLLLSQRPGLDRPPPAVLWQASQATLARLGDAAEQLESVRRYFVSERAFVELADETPRSQMALAAELRSFFARLLAAVDAPRLALQSLLFRRAVRLLLVVSALIASFAIAYATATRKPDLARGKPWRTSSVHSICHPERGQCGSARTYILFHTLEEMNPWFEYDMGAPVSFSSLTIKNRSDAYQERAVPLVLEVSDDQKQYRELARRSEPFRVWEPEFAPQRARFIRLRAARKTFLHLERIQVHP